MKSIKFLAALAVPAMFAACTNEELVAVQQEAQQSKEFVGAELIGKGVKLNLGTVSGSRLAADGTWTPSDKLGLGWVVSGAYNSDQSEAIAPTSDNLYGNHLFYYNEEEGDFNTMANIYTGWHFAYYPFNHMEKLGGEKIITINPAQEEEWVLDINNSCFYVSPRQFLSPANLNEETYQLENVRFEVERAFSAIGINIQPDQTFTKKNILKLLKVKSITLKYNNDGIFARKALLKPTQLATNKDGLKASLAQALTKYGSGYKSITTEVKNEAIDLSGNNTLRLFVLPEAKNKLKAEAFEFEIEVEGGKFTVKYPEGVAEDSDDPVAKSNWKTFVTLRDAFATGGRLAEGKTLYDTESPTREGLSLQLTADMFEAATGEIKSEIEWNHAVNVVYALGKKDVTFNIAKGEDGKAWSFTDVDGDGNLINLPEGANVTVTGENMILAAEGNWPAEGLTVNTGVVVNANLTVADNVVMTATQGIVNNAIITGGYKSKINDVENNDEIKVIYGTFVKVKNNNYGVISYDVPAIGSLDEEGKELTEARIQQRIEYLIARTGNEKYATVNKLNVNSGVSLNLSKQTEFGSAGAPSDDDLYRPSTPGDPTFDKFELIPSLKFVSLEINGGTVTSTNTASLVKAVVNGGTLRNVTLANGLTATDATVEATSIVGGVEATNSTVTAETIEGGLKTTKSTIEVTSSIKGGVKATESTITAETIEGGLTATDATITAEAITVESNGTVVLKGATTINNAEITGNVTVENGTTSLNNVNINGDMIIKAGAKVVIAGKDTKITNIDNYGELTTSVNVYTETVEIFKGSKANVAEDKTIWYNTPSYGEYGYTQEGNTNGSILYRNLMFVNNNKELDEALKNTEVSAIVLGNGEYTIDLYSDAHSKTSLSIFGVEGTKVKFANQQVRLGIFDKFTIQNCEILKMETKVWGMLVFASGKENGVYTVSNCTFNGVETQGIYINESSSNVVYNIKGCTFNGKFGNEGPITIQENNVAVNIKINDCSFTNRGDESVRNICILDHSANDNTILDTDVEDSQVSKVRRY